MSLSFSVKCKRMIQRNPGITDYVSPPESGPSQPELVFSRAKMFLFGPKVLQRMAVD
jgi:hypothetical protein